ncbi:hypothetical protein ACFRDV_12215 [Streptomyces fagopyri]|uniref:hypothetical protein n=1 Tax=Streptomyces fagopyri TaxID=2662397 RepID=UPI0036B42FEA
MRKGIVALTVLVGLTAVGCGDGSRGGVVITGTPPATPYAGPLDVPFKENADEGVHEAEEASGAAGRALECDGEIHEGSGGGRWSEWDGGSTPEGGLRAYFDIEQPEVPNSGYRVERKEDGRVLFSYDVDGRTKVAVVVAEDQPHRPGWGPDTAASCDPGELPARYTDSRYEIWTDRSGRRLPTTTVSSSAGPEHCDWESAHFLQTGRAMGGKQYARDPHGVLGDALLTSAYDGHAHLPADARDTGYRFKGWALWLAVDKSTAYVRTPHGVEAWPETKDTVGCQ